MEKFSFILQEEEITTYRQIFDELRKESTYINKVTAMQLFSCTLTEEMAKRVW